MSTTPPPPPGDTPPSPGGGFGQAPPPGPVPGPAFTPAGMPQDPSFWKKLFELDFRHFVTPSVVKILYILWIIMASIYGLILLFAGLAGLSDNGSALILVLLAPVAWFLMVVYGRVIIEVFIALIRTAQNTTILVDRQGGAPGQPPQTF